MKKKFNGGCGKLLSKIPYIECGFEVCGKGSGYEDGEIIYCKDCNNKFVNGGKNE